MIPLSSSIFFGTALADPAIATQRLLSATYNLADLKDSLAVLDTDRTFQIPYRSFLTALESGDLDRARHVIRAEIAPLLERIPPEIWRTWMNGSPGLFAPLTYWQAFFRRPKHVVTNVLRPLPQNEMPLKEWLDDWKIRLEAAHQLPWQNQPAENEKKEGAYTTLKRELIERMKQAKNLEELSSILQATGHLNQLLQHRWNTTDARAVARRIFLKYWEPGVVFSWSPGIVEVFKHLFEQFSCIPNSEDTAWFFQNIIDCRNVSSYYYTQETDDQKAWEIVKQESHSLYERMMAVMFLTESTPYNVHRSNAPSIPGFFDYVEARARERKLDIVDLTLVFGLAGGYRRHPYGLRHYSEATQEALIDAVIYFTPMVTDYGPYTVPFGDVFRPYICEDLNTPKNLFVMRQLPPRLQFKLIRSICEKAIALKMPSLDIAVITPHHHPSSDISVDQLEELLALYKKDEETTLIHIEAVVRLIEKLPMERRLPHYDSFWNLLKPCHVAQYSKQMEEVLEKAWKHGDHAHIKNYLLQMLATADEAYRLHSQAVVRNGQYYDWCKLFKSLIQRFSDFKQTAAHLQTWLKGQPVPFCFEEISELVLQLLPHQKREWALQIAQLIFAIYADDRLEKAMSGGQEPPEDLSKLLEPLTPEEKKSIFYQEMLPAYFQDPSSEEGAIRLRVIQKNFGEIPDLKLEEGLSQYLQQIPLDAELKTTLERLVRQPAHPLTAKQAWIVAIAAAQTCKNPATRSFFRNVTQNTPQDGMVYEWILLFRDLQAISKKERDDFIAEQNTRFDAMQNKARFIPPRIRKTLTNWLRQRFAEKIGLDTKETAQFQSHYAKHAQAWHEKEFYNYLVTLSGFVEKEGLDAIKTLVVQSVRNLNFSFRYRGMTRLFGAAFTARWRKNRGYAVQNMKTDSAETAKKRFFFELGEMMQEHLGENEKLFSLLPDPVREKYPGLAKDLNAILEALRHSKCPERDRVGRVCTFFEQMSSIFRNPNLEAFNEIHNDLKELRRGWDRAFKETKNGEVLFSGDPRDIVRAGLIGKKSCTRPTDPAPGNRKAEPVGRALHGPLMIAIFKIDGEEVARSLVEVTVQKDGIHYTAEPLYEEGGFNQSQAFAEILMKDATLLGIDPSQVHIHFSGLNMKSLPTLLPTSFPVYNDSFPRSNAPAPHYGFSS